MDNAIINACLCEISEAVERRQSNSELAGLLRRISAEKSTLSYNHTYAFRSIAVGFTLFALIVFLKPAGSNLGTAAILAVLCWIAISAWSIHDRNRRYGSIQVDLQDLYQANLLGIEEEAIDPEEKAYELGMMYFEFQRGNHMREITSLRSGKATLSTGRIPIKGTSKNPNTHCTWQNIG